MHQKSLKALFHTPLQLLDREITLSNQPLRYLDDLQLPILMPSTMLFVNTNIFLYHNIAWGCGSLKELKLSLQMEIHVTLNQK